MFIKADTIIYVSETLSLPYDGTEQDWPVEVADKDRLPEFIGYLEVNTTAPDVKYAIMSLVFVSYDDYIEEYGPDENSWRAITILLDSDRKLYAPLLNYWALLDEPKNADVFYLTQPVRDYLKGGYTSQSSRPTYRKYPIIVINALVILWSFKVMFFDEGPSDMAGIFAFGLLALLFVYDIYMGLVYKLYPGSINAEYSEEERFLIEGGYMFLLFLPLVILWGWAM